MAGHRKTVKHYHEPGDVHELTFSCYQRKPLLTNNTWRGYLAESIEAACRSNRFRLAAFVFMPEHVHLLVLPELPEPDIGAFLAAVKRPCSARIKDDLTKANSRLLERLTVLERPGKTAFRFWQEGPGYDRNLQKEKTVLSSIDYLHNNPVRRGLCKDAKDWFWSSIQYYVTEPPIVEPMLPIIHGLPPDFFTNIKGG
ncbi:MAG: transposase [Pirellulales bacterium]|nr:transposase [Pirellulales bacterium]